MKREWVQWPNLIDLNQGPRNFGPCSLSVTTYGFINSSLHSLSFWKVGWNILRSFRWNCDPIDYWNINSRFHALMNDSCRHNSYYPLDWYGYALCLWHADPSPCKINAALELELISPLFMSRHKYSDTDINTSRRWRELIPSYSYVSWDQSRGDIK